MGGNWIERRRSDKYYKKAKASGYRSRASYKLLYIQEKYSLMRLGDTVIELGAAPGGWSQVAVECVGTEGLVLGFDLQEIAPLASSKFFVIDLLAPEALGQIGEALAAAGKKKANAVISDMAPNISGNYSLDHARSVAMCERALEVAQAHLAPGGSFAVKIFQGDMYGDFLKKAQTHFRMCKGYKSHASRAESSELYIVGKGFIPSPALAETR